VSFASDTLSAESLSERFRQLLFEGVHAAARQGELDQLPSTFSVAQTLATVSNREWRVYVKPPFGGAEGLLEYLSQYTYRTAISNNRIESYANHQVRFRWRDLRDGKVKRSRFEGMEFIRRFLLHVLPARFVRIRGFGFMSNRHRKRNIERVRQLIGPYHSSRPRREPLQRIRLCPHCSAARREKRICHFVPQPAVPQFELPLRSPPSSVAA
jgi:Putative transposase